MFHQFPFLNEIIPLLAYFALLLVTLHFYKYFLSSEYEAVKTALKYACLILIVYVLLQGSYLASFIVILVPLLAFFYFLYHTGLRQYNSIAKFVNLTTLKLQTVEQAMTTKLSRLPYPLEIFIGLSLIVFPEPTGISDVVGVKLVEDGMRKRGI
jgi:hypothetical protein